MPSGTVPVLFLAVTGYVGGVPVTVDHAVGALAVTNGVTAKTGTFATTGIADSLTIDSAGGIPGLRARSEGETKGYWAVAKTPGNFLGDALAGDMIFRSEANRILFGLAGGTGNSACFVGADGLEVTAAGGGPIVKSPNGTRYRISVANNGTLSTAAV